MANLPGTQRRPDERQRSGILTDPLTEYTIAPQAKMKQDWNTVSTSYDQPFATVSVQELVFDMSKQESLSDLQ
jgi:hypothetical protein